MVALKLFPESLTFANRQDQRRVVVMHHVHGIDLETLAASEGVPLGTIKSRLHRGRAALIADREGR